MTGLTLNADGSFVSTARNAHNVEVRFMGTYALGRDKGTPIVTLRFNDRPNEPSVLYYRLDGTGLRAAASPSELDAGGGTSFSRR
jgi:hypothetical protein